MGLPTGKEAPLLRTWSETATELVLPRGATSVVRGVFAGEGLDPDWIDERHAGDPMMAGHIPGHRMTLWEHQGELLEAMLKREQGIVHSPTGSGKTTTAIAVIARLQLPAVVMVWSTSLAAQWVERLSAELGLHADDIGLVGDGVTRWRPVTVAMQQSLSADPAKLKKATELAGVVIADEVQRFAAVTFGEVISKFPARYRFGVSDDSRRKDGKECLTYDTFGTVIATVERKVLEARGDTVPVSVVLVPTEFTADWYLQQAQQASRSGYRFRARPDFTRLVGEMTACAKRNELALGVFRRAMDRSDGAGLLLSLRREHCEVAKRQLTASGVDCGLLLGGKASAKEFAATRDALVGGQLRVAAGTISAIGQAFDVKRLSVGLATTPLHLNRMGFQQVRGRLCRAAPGKVRGVLYVLWDRAIHGDDPLRSFLKWNDDDVEVYDFASDTYKPGRSYLSKRAQ